MKLVYIVNNKEIKNQIRNTPMRSHTLDRPNVTQAIKQNIPTPSVHSDNLNVSTSVEKICEALPKLGNEAVVHAIKIMQSLPSDAHDIVLSKINNSKI